MKNTNPHVIVQEPSSPLPDGFLNNLPELFEEQGTLIYQKRNQIKTFEVNGHKLCVKKYGIAPLLNRFLYSVSWRTPKAEHTYKNAAKILERGFVTPRQYGYVLIYRKGWLAESYSVGEFVEGVRSVEDARKDEDLMKAFARYTAQLHMHGMMHRDYILNNILYSRTADGYQFTLIDVNRFIFHDKPIRGFLQRMNLMQPFNKLSELKKFVSAYSQEIKAPPSLCWQVVYFRIWRTRYSQFKCILRKIPGAKLIAKYK